MKGNGKNILTKGQVTPSRTKERLCGDTGPAIMRNTEKQCQSKTLFLHGRPVLLHGR